MSELAFPLSDALLEACVARARELGLIEEPRKRWSHVEGVADHIGCSIKRVYELRARGLPARQLPGEKPGTLSKKLLFDLDEVDDWIERTGVKV